MDRAQARREREEAFERGESPDSGGLVAKLDPLFSQVRGGLKALKAYDALARRATRVAIVERRYDFLDLATSLEGFRILQLSDLHIDGYAGFAERLARRLSGLKVDLIVLTGDFRFDVKGRHDAAVAGLRHALAGVTSRYGKYAVLGNHDVLAMVDPLEDAGINVLLNEGEEIEVDDALLHVAGCDDASHFRTHDVGRAMTGASSTAFKLFLSHAPDAAAEAAAEGADLFLCGHTHGGQINPWKGRPLITNSEAPRRLCQGEWEYGAMIGYTSSGVGFSGLPLRTFTRSEAVVHELHSL